MVLQLSDNLDYPIIFEHAEKNGYPILSDICENYRISDNKLSERISIHCIIIIIIIIIIISISMIIINNSNNIDNNIIINIITIINNNHRNRNNNNNNNNNNNAMNRDALR